jgi:hypothetical protein
MSKKSRKRNKKILAAIGIGLGAAALASRKNKSDLASTEDGKSGSTKKPSIADVAGPKKDTAKKSDYKDSIMSGGSGVKYSKSTPIKKAKITLGVGDGGPLKLKDNSIRTRNRDTNAAGIKEPNKPMIASIFPKSETADNYAGDMRDFQKTNYKSGGRVKGCGKALRGFGNAMKGKK